MVWRCATRCDGKATSHVIGRQLRVARDFHYILSTLSDVLHTDADKHDLDDAHSPSLRFRDSLSRTNPLLSSLLFSSLDEDVDNV